jgi:hypothetical protein
MPSSQPLPTTEANLFKKILVKICLSKKKLSIYKNFKNCLEML